MSLNLPIAFGIFFKSLWLVGGQSAMVVITTLLLCRVSVLCPTSTLCTTTATLLPSSRLSTSCRSQTSSSPYIYVAVPDRNRMLFHHVFRTHHPVWYVSMRVPPLAEAQRYSMSNLRDRITFNFCRGLPRIYWLQYWKWSVLGLVLGLGLVLVVHHVEQYCSCGFLWQCFYRCECYSVGLLAVEMSGRVRCCRMLTPSAMDWCHCGDQM